MSRLTEPLPILAVVAAGVAAAATGAVLLSQPQTEGEGTPRGSVYILGPARSMLAKGLYERADLYFHKGVGHKKEEAFHGFFQRWREQIVPSQHAHAEGREIEEILPWLRLATRSDPHNIEIYLVASYWLAGECGRPELARQAIEEAIAKNPDRYELHLEMGRLYLAESQYETALQWLNSAEQSMKSCDPADSEQAAIDIGFILMGRSYINEALGHYPEAIQATSDYLALKPEHAGIRQRLDRLQNGIFSPESARDKLKLLFHKEHECAYEDHDHDHDHDHLHSGE